MPLFSREGYKLSEAAKVIIILKILYRLANLSSGNLSPEDKKIHEEEVEKLAEQIGGFIPPDQFVAQAIAACGKLESCNKNAYAFIDSSNRAEERSKEATERQAKCSTIHQQALKLIEEDKKNVRDLLKKEKDKSVIELQQLRISFKLINMDMDKSSERLLMKKHAIKTSEDLSNKVTTAGIELNERCIGYRELIRTAEEKLKQATREVSITSDAKEEALRLKEIAEKAIQENTQKRAQEMHVIAHQAYMVYSRKASLSS
jgi:hypothetical protein